MPGTGPAVAPSRSVPDFELGLYREGIISTTPISRPIVSPTAPTESWGSCLIRCPNRGAPLDFTPEGMKCNMTQDEFESGVACIKERILSGEAFQVVLSRSLSAPVPENRWHSTRTSAGPTPLPTCSSSAWGISGPGRSPETLVRVGAGGDHIPIAGTRPSEGPEERRRLGEEMLLDEKERAEH